MGVAYLYNACSDWSTVKMSDKMSL